MPRVTIGVPVFNGERYLATALDSALEQDFGDLEVIIADNGSTDSSPEIAREYAQRDARVRLFRHAENLGAARNYNFLVDQAQGEYFRWLAHDDLCGPGLITKCVHALESRPDAVLAFARTRFIDAGGETLSELEALPWDGSDPASRLGSLLTDDLASHLHRCGPVLGLMRTDSLRRTRRILPHNSSDKVLLVEMALLGDWVEVPEALQWRRIHDQNSLVASKDEAAVAAWFDPRSGGRFPMPRSRVFLGYLTSVLRTPLGVVQKARCLAMLGRFFSREWRVLGGEIKIKLRERLP